MSFASGRTATVKYYARNKYGKMVLTKTEKVPIPFDVSLLHRTQSNPMADKIIDIVVSILVTIAVIGIIFAALNGALTPTQFLMLMQDVSKTVVIKIQSILQTIYQTYVNNCQQDNQ